MRKSIFLLVSLSVSFTAQAGDIQAGKARSNTCVPCHGSQGISSNPVWPDLAGQKEQYLTLQLKAFRDGAREHPLMTPMAQGLSDEDIANLAAYYSSLSASP
jgi:cytochrome c553